MDESPDALPRRFGRYVLFDRIGEGGMARIYLARTTTELGGERVLVVKQVLPQLAEREDFARLLTEEAKLAAELHHGNVVQVTDLGREEGVLYIAMEYVEGFDLSQLMRQCAKAQTPLPAEFALFIVAELLRGLDYAHRKKDEEGQPLGIVHRDVSPSNVLISFDGEVKLCDFGIARALAAEATPESDIRGKAGYMSPEVAAGSPADVRSDVFAAGVILWETLAGRRMVRGTEGKAPTLEQARTAEVPPLPERGLAREPELRAIVERALAREPAARFASAQQMLRALEAYVAEADLGASPVRLGEWLLSRFGGEIVETRRARQRAAKAVEAGPLVQITALARAHAENPPLIDSLRSVLPPPESGEPAPPTVPTTPAAEAPASGPGAWLYFAVAVAVLLALAAWLR